LYFVFLQDDQLEVSSPKMYSSFIPNGRAEPHLHTPRHQGVQLGDPDLNLSQGDGELSGLPTPDSTPELPFRNMKALRHHPYEKNENCNNGKDKNPKSGPSCSKSSQGFMAVAGNSLSQQGRIPCGDFLFAANVDRNQFRQETSMKHSRTRAKGGWQSFPQKQVKEKSEKNALLSRSVFYDSYKMKCQEKFTD
ncbi:hypothetical protein XENOCAPTIV_015407, partial [Xenoophorus captivus]